MNTTTAAQSESATDEEEPSAGLSSSGLPSSEDSDSSLYVQRKELWPLADSSDEEQSDEEPALQSTATSGGATASASGATATKYVSDDLQCDICHQVHTLYK